jgi:hypothetical protein
MIAPMKFVIRDATIDDAEATARVSKTPAYLTRWRRGGGMMPHSLPADPEARGADHEVGD